jgi:tetratricopeptide (TPR) repeat protein
VGPGRGSGWAGRCVRVDLLRRAAEDAFQGGDPDGAASLAREAIAGTDPGTEPVLAGVLHDRLARFVWDTTDQAETLAIQRRAVELVPAQPPSAARAQVLAGLGGQLQVLGRYHEARQVSEEAVEMAQAVGAAQPESVALNTLGTITCTLEDVDLGLRLLEAALGMAKAYGDAQEQMRGWWNPFATTFSAARWDEAEQMIEDARRQQRAGEHPVRLPELDLGRGNLDAARGYLERQRAEEPCRSGAPPRSGPARAAAGRPGG